MADGARWFALHAFLSDPRLLERFLVEWVRPTVGGLLSEGHVTAWFFIRYWEGGPHVRLRLKCKDGDVLASVKRDLEAKVHEWTTPEPLDRQSYYANHPLDGMAVDIDELPWYGEGAVREIPYEPELVRYGGPHAIGPSEDAFQLSSEIAMAVIDHTRDDMNRRLALSPALMVQAGLSLGKDFETLRDYFTAYARIWSHYSEATRKTFEAAQSLAVSPGLVTALEQQAKALSGARPDSPQALWRTGLTKLGSTIRSLASEGKLWSPRDGSVTGTDAEADYAWKGILASQIHMLNNRLGIVPPQEVLLALQIAGAAGKLL